MLGQGNAALAVVLAVDVAGIGIERHLGVDDQVLVLGQIDQHVRTLALTLAIGDADLALEVFAGDQTGALQHILQDQFTPVALGLFLATQGGTQVMGFLGDLPIELLQVIELAGQRGLLLGVLVVDVLDLEPKLVDLLAKGFEQIVQ